MTLPQKKKCSLDPNVLYKLCFLVNFNRKEEYETTFGMEEKILKLDTIPLKGAVSLV